jgi:hypothetical protein
MNPAGWMFVALARSALARATVAPPVPMRSEVAPGIWRFQTAPYGDVGLDGNPVAIVSDDGVRVFDANGTPAAARGARRDPRAHEAAGALTRLFALGPLVRRRGLPRGVPWARARQPRQAPLAGTIERPRVESR